tara:strand:- start:161 stop:517 length:357 start_codon:yes stop_codon:yes gene_type:complete
MATALNLPAVQRGDSVTYTLNFTDGVSPINMQSKTLIMTFKFSNLMPDSEASLTKTITIAADDTDAASGAVAFMLQSSETSLLAAGVIFNYGLRIIESASPENIETTYLYGDISVMEA